MNTSALLKEKPIKMELPVGFVPNLRGSLGRADCTEETKETKETKEFEEFEEPDEIDEVDAYIWERINKTITAYLVDADKLINGPLFALAREVRGCEQELGKRFSLILLREIIDEWKSINREHLGIGHDYLVDLLDKLSLVRFPAGRVLIEAFEVAKKQSAPKRTLGLPADVQNLAKLCRELQRRAKTEPFFLDGRSAAKVMGRPHETVASWLRALRRLPLIVVVSKWRQGFALRYKYVGRD